MPRTADTAERTALLHLRHELKTLAQEERKLRDELRALDQLIDSMQGPARSDMMAANADERRGRLLRRSDLSTALGIIEFRRIEARAPFLERRANRKDRWGDKERELDRRWKDFVGKMVRYAESIPIKPHVHQMLEFIAQWWEARRTAKTPNSEVPQ